MRKIEMIALDLDGTALQPDHLTVSREMEKVLEQAYEKGIRIVPVTGRPYRLLPPFLLAHPSWESHAVLCNGAQIRDLRTREIKAHFPVEQDFLRQVLDLTDRYDLPVEFNSDGRLYLTKASRNRELLEPKMFFHCTVLLPKNGVLVESLRDYCDMEVEKIHINCIPEDKWDALEQELKELDVSVVCEKPPNLEVTHRRATKGQGLTALCRELEIPLENVMALGDSGNDFSMLEVAGLSVAMGSAPEAIQRASDYVTGTNLEDGAAAAIRKFAL